MQVWNVNRYSGIVGAFHLQGASWSRTRRQFLVHDETPPPLATQVRHALSASIGWSHSTDADQMQTGQLHQPMPMSVIEHLIAARAARCSIDHHSALCACLWLESIMLAVQVRAADVELLLGSPEGHTLAKAAGRWVAFDSSTRALHHLNDSSDFVALQLHGAPSLQSMSLAL